MMTKSEKRRARKVARADGERLDGEIAVDQPACEFSETSRGHDARERWAERYDEFNGAPEGDWDR